MAGSQGHSATRQALGAGGEEGLNLRKEPVNVAAGKEETEDDLVEGEFEDQKSEVKVLDFKFKFYLLTVDRQYIFLLCAHFSAPICPTPPSTILGQSRTGAEKWAQRRFFDLIQNLN